MSQLKTTQLQGDKSFKLNLDFSRDALLTDFGKTTLEDRYLLKGETYQSMFSRVASYYADDESHAQRLYDYMSKMWFMPATPILSNGGTDTGLPISCFLNKVHDTLVDIMEKIEEHFWLASNGGGIGTYWGDVRSIGEGVRKRGKTSGIMPFIKTQDSLTLAVSQGLLRRGSAAVYLPVSHPEIEEFIEMRRPTGGDINRKAMNLHHAVVIPDDFMHAVEKDLPWHLKSPKTGATISIVKARDLWIRILTARIETGEPYLLFIDNVNRALPESYKRLGLKVETSNLCNEIVLATGEDPFGNQRTAVCCLSSVNLEQFDAWKDDERFIEDIMRFLDNVLQDFIDKAPDAMKNAKYSASRERSVGLGVMGLHSFLQSKMVPIESVSAKSWNKLIFKHIRSECDKASKKLAIERGPCPDAAEANVAERFSHKMAVAPTASISIIAGNSSPGIEPYNSNAFTQKTLSGSFNVKNKHLKDLLQKKSEDTDEVWSSIMNNDGSVQHLEFLTQHEKDVFKTAFEIDQRWLIDLAADRANFICQGQSLNIFVPANIHKRDLHLLHFNAWKGGIKGMYYSRSKSLQRADTVSIKRAKPHVQLELQLVPKIDGASENPANSNSEECLACQ